MKFVLFMSSFLFLNKENKLMSYFTIFLLFNNNTAKIHRGSPRIKSVFGSYQVRTGFFKENLHNITKWNSFLK